MINKVYLEAGEEIEVLRISRVLPRDVGFVAEQDGLCKDKHLTPAHLVLARRQVLLLEAGRAAATEQQAQGGHVALGNLCNINNFFSEKVLLAAVTKFF